MRTPFVTVALTTSLALTLTACTGEDPTAKAAPAPVATTAAPTPSATPSASESVDNTAIGKAMAGNAITTRAILEGVWKDTPQAKRVGTCGRWASTPADIYTVPLFATMDRAVVKTYFDEVCRTL